MVQNEKQTMLLVHGTLLTYNLYNTEGEVLKSVVSVPNKFAFEADTVTSSDLHFAMLPY